MLSDRIEVKYVVDAAQRAAILDACADRLLPDPFSVAGPYRVTSQYFDSPDQECLWEKLDGVERRKKIRLRFYGDVRGPEDLAPGGLFFEVKHRIGRRILKERVPLTKPGCLALLGDPTGVAHLRDAVDEADLAKHTGTVDLIERLAQERALRPANVISYRREAWRGELEHDLRVNFDGDLSALPPDAWDQAPTTGLALLPDGWFVFEVKFERRLANWLRQILVRVGVRAQPYSKYAEGMLALSGQPSHATARSGRPPVVDRDAP